MILVYFLSFSSLFALALSLCSPPPSPGPVPFPTVNFEERTMTDGLIAYYCPGDYFPYGNFGAGGPLLTEAAAGYKCDPANGKLINDATGMETTLTTAICRPTSALSAGFCMFILNDVTFALENGQSDITCPGGVGPGLLPNAGRVPSIRCQNSKLYAILNGNDVSVGENNPPRQIACAGNLDSPATASQLWSVKYYYNYGLGVHAFCADQACINAIQSNGIGYDMNNGNGLMSRAVSESMIDSVRASCPTGSKNLRNLGFTKSGNKYLHNFNGSGLKQGWVSITNGSCGANVPIKRWKSRYSDDMMYGVNLEWNNWYEGMVQEDGQAQFYMWE